VPLLLTVTVATIGLAAWIWSERHSDDEYEEDDRTEPRPDGSQQPPVYRDSPPRNVTYKTDVRPTEETTSYMARMSGALRRAPSPQQILDSTSRTVVAGVAAAGAVVGSALSSIREEDKNAYKDHKTWEEEAEARKSIPSSGAAVASSSVHPKKKPVSQETGRRKTVAVVISADADGDGMDDGEDYMQEHAVWATKQVYVSDSVAYLYSLSYHTFQRTLISHAYAFLSSSTRPGLRNTRWT
jgi:hypothetical protein